MLKALGIKKKSKPPSEEQISKYEEQKKQRDQWRYDTARLTSIIGSLQQKYSAHKGDFAMGRYEELKAMIKEAGLEHKDVEEEIKARSQQRACKIADKYRQKTGSTGSNNNNTTAAAAAGGGKKSTITSLTQRAAGFASLQGADEELSVHEMSGKQVDEELTKFRKEILQYKQDFKAEKDKLLTLAKEYEDSKKQAPPQRYQTMKNMIKDVTRSAT